MKLLLKE
jgi:hypothetical protein